MHLLRNTFLRAASRYLVGILAFTLTLSAIGASTDPDSQQIKSEYKVSGSKLLQYLSTLEKDKSSKKQKFEKTRDVLETLMKEASRSKQDQEHVYLAAIDTFLVTMVGHTQTCSTKAIEAARQEERQSKGDKPESLSLEAPSLELKVALHLRNLICK